MDEQGRHDPGSWSANQSDAGWALLGTVWSSVFAAGSALAAADGNEDVAEVLGILTGIAGLVALITLTMIGCRLAFGRATPRPRKARSDAQIIVALTMGVVLATTVVAVLVLA